jgi:competence ComEA-like helix-hairpin-helix protein
LEPEEVVQQVPSEEIQEESQIQSTDEAVEKLDLNAASLVEIERLPGVGYRIAQSIVAYRESSGSFNSIEDLSNVPGIDPDDIFALQQYFYIEPQKTPPPEIEQKTDQGQINAARMAASAGDQEKAIIIYSELIQAKSSLDEVIFDLNQAIHTRPEDYELWQLLGDAYMRNDQMIEAMQAYNKAEELLGY